jgi:GTP-dependent phosphoenolpyruvate carboxykinase
MGDQAFIKFVNCVGQLSIRDKFTWTRNTEDTYEYLTKEMLREITYKFNTKYPGNNIIVLSSKWM